MNNSVFGKTMENLRNRIDVRLVRPHETDRMRKLIASSLFARATVFGETLAVIQMHKNKITLNRRVYTGMCIMDLSKTLMYDVYYNHLKLKYGSRCDLLYTDTDSLLLEIKTDDVYKDMENRLDELYDTSDYPKDHFLYSQKNKKVVGKMKDECSILLGSNNNVKINIKKAKSTTKQVTSKVINHQNYKDALFNKKFFKHGMGMLRSERHNIYGIHVNKITLSPFDSKRWIANDGIHTLTYGHKDLKDQH